jgi:acyl-homoserine lactone acylase PvdQ
MTFTQKRYDDETQTVARLAKQYQKQVKGITWGEAIRLAEKHVSERKANP